MNQYRNTFFYIKMRIDKINLFIRIEINNNLSPMYKT